MNPFKPVTSFQQPKEVTKKARSLQKFLTAKMAYSWGETGILEAHLCPVDDLV
ncbi:hypothetical protein C427_3083 [Paraglaciecola psychrophila 170]|uniref:Uncharacterized protein n=1 Tax=Paraglaciecola psychrophila 170 TaxID=1129794 RepID=K7ADC7_9ALTE|nr:hypothetical protein C427_3083 [Paraglaciecola psychrophila 170]GAC38668.1 hypothetical protein GPSY_3057 [Paraglaciecola psychrophila 170]